MKIFVITPVGPNPDLKALTACIESVAAQDAEADITHLLVYDMPLSQAPSYPGPHNVLWIGLPSTTADIGSTPRTVGVAYAWGAGADAVAFLDADCRYLPDHLSRLLAFQKKTGKPVVCSSRFLEPLDGSDRQRCYEISPTASPPFHDTNTFLIMRAGIGLSYTFGTLTGTEQHKIGDRILTERALPYLACHYHPTVIYRSAHQCHYHHFAWPVPPGVTLKNLAAPTPEPEPAATT